MHELFEGHLMHKGSASQTPRLSGSGRAREETLAQAVHDVASELRLVDPTDYIAFVRTEKHANISDLVKSSTELYFKNETLRYGLGANIDLDWDTTPTVRLDLEFRNNGVWIYFGLVLHAKGAGVDIYHIEFADPSEDPEENTRRLIDAIMDARLKPLAN
ncbi:hypothetical protein [Polymorphum gilvum]|uniref:Hypothetical conserved protein n=1 Tax=Polymorphum gilvum (strain LMG 25793 / CGMCC 1.9160 / SL003B-26A1) TaxID=991905 RepID=F2J4M7_POLGS|nr:hypothetical protein [Polymorphum gilvum]ADZ72279.1 Hypothetical conserved protein [Polymorphum gilvum SL003B-26A1]